MYDYERNGTFHGKPDLRQDGRFQRNFLLSVKKAQYANTTWNKAKKSREPAVQRAT